jgi:sec-independent protein translocase protein TatA
MGFGEILIIVLVILILFGSKKIPDLAQGLGKGIREFKKAIKDVEDDIKKPAADDTKSDNKTENK